MNQETKRWRIQWRSMLLAGAFSAALAAGGAHGSTTPGRVIVLAIEGAGARELAALEAAGELSEGGFRRLATIGARARSMRSSGAQGPTAALMTIATGAEPAAHGMLADRVHLPNQILREWTDAARLPVRAETLWQAAREVSWQTGIIRWPGVDNRSVARRGNWGVLPDGDAEFTQRALNIRRDAYRDEHYGRGPGPAARWAMPPGISSYSPPLTFSLEYNAGATLYRMIYDIIAVDRTDDGTVNYDGMVLTDKVNPAEGFLGVLEPGGWFRLDMPMAAASAVSGLRPAAWMHLIELAPDLSTTRLYVGAAYSPRLYPGSIRRQLEIRDLVSPGPPDMTALVRTSAFAPRGTTETVAGQLRLGAEFVAGAALAGTHLPWDLILARAEPFEQAARVQTYDRQQARFLRRAAWRAADRAVEMLLDEMDLTTQTLVVVSSQSYQEISVEIDLSEVLRGSPEVAALLAEHQEYGLAPIFRVLANDGAAFIYVNEEGKSDDGFLTRDEAESVEKVLARVLSRYRSSSGKVIEKVVRGSALAKMGLGGPGVPALAVLARPGVRLIDHGRGAIVRYDPPSQWYAGGYGEGAAEPGIYFEAGAGVAAGKRLGTIRLEEIAGRIAARLGMPAPSGPAPK